MVMIMPYRQYEITDCWDLGGGGKSVNWASQNPEIVTVDGNGVVTYVSAGTATITATAANGTTETCTIETINGIGTPDREASIEEVFTAYITRCVQIFFRV